ncbi:MAG TPA: type 4a pilus biogenesis protein PilO [Vicinamibacterales bacterium]
MDLSLSKLPWKTQLAVFAVIAAAAVGSFYWYYVQGVHERLAAQQKTLDGLKANIAKGQATARQLPEFQKQVAELEARLAALRDVLPEEKDVGDLLRGIQTLAVQSNLQIRGFKPAPIVARQLHAEWPIRLELDGTYHNLGQFFDRVGKYARIINIGDVQIKAKEQPQPGSTISVDCTAMTFVLQEPAAKAAAPAGPRPAAPKAS